MNWIKNVVRPKIRGLFEKKESGEALWIKCPQSGELIFHKDLVANQWVVPSSDYHMRIGARERLALFFDHGDYETIEAAQPLNDPLKFRDQKRYTDRLRDARSKTGMDDSVLAALGNLHGREITVAIHEFAFMGGSMGIAAGAAILAATERACAKRTPLVIFAASGGARMQEGIFSLMQMPRTTVGIRRLQNAGLPYIVVLTNPTTGGVTASYAMLGDVHIAEPGALVGFAGPRVIEQTIREKLPDEFQRSEYLLKHGMVDMVVHRHDLPATVAKICDLLYWRKDLAAADINSAVHPAALLAKDDALSATANEQEIIPPSAAGK